MKKKNVKNQASNVFSLLEMSLIDKSNYNPRKTFDETELEELACSIAEKGVIQPIVVRRKGDRYELVCGERRFRASLLAEQQTIPACIRELTDEEAEEFAITENLQRKDVAPMEEARAFARLIETGKYDIAALVTKFGKSDPFVRSRIKLVELILPFQTLLEKEEINLGVANTLSNYTSDLQETIYNEHFHEDCSPYSSWLDKRPVQLQKAIENAYSTRLEKYFFDKGECVNCPFNTKNFLLFSEEDAVQMCTKQNCLHTKNVEFVYSKAISMQQENPQMCFCKDTTWATNEAVVNRLIEEGYEIQRVNLVTDYQDEEPTMPQREEFEEEEDFAEALSDYEEERTEYQEALAERDSLLEQGKLKAFIQIEKFNVRVAYSEISNAMLDSSSSESGRIGNAVRVNPEIIKLQNKMIRNNELCGEKIEANLKEELKAVQVQGKSISELEEALMYLFMCRKVRQENYPLLGFEKDVYKLKYTDCLALSDAQKAIIIREYVVKHLGELYLSSNVINEDNALVAFMNEHVQDKVTMIFNEQEAAYKKRNERLEERITAMKVDDTSAKENVED